MSITVDRCMSAIVRAEYSAGDHANSWYRPRLMNGAAMVAAHAAAAPWSSARRETGRSLALGVVIVVGWNVCGRLMTNSSEEADSCGFLCAVTVYRMRGGARASIRCGHAGDGERFSGRRDQI